MNKKLFNIYYLNLSKVYEIAMILDNKILSNLTRETTNSNEEKGEIKAKASVTSGIVNSNFEDSYAIKLANSSKVVETLEIKTTKSILLRNILGKCIVLTNKKKKINVGDLIYVDNVKLSLINEKELRAFKMLRNDAIKGLQYEGLDLNNLIASLLNDYSYNLTGKSPNITNDILMKIPMIAGNEFENLYTIDDLLIGNVSVIGIYRGKAKKSDIKNSFESLSQENKPEPANFKYELSDDYNNVATSPNSSSNDYDFIDIIAIIQNVKSNDDYIENKNAPITKKDNFLKIIINKLLRR